MRFFTWVVDKVVAINIGRVKVSRWGGNFKMGGRVFGSWTN